MNDNKVIMVGLCGRSGAGKGYVSRIFAEHGIPSIDTDAVYKELTAPSATLSQCMEELVNRFGRDVACSDNSLNRAVLRNIVFNGDGQALLDLNNITHKFILGESVKKAKKMYDDGFPIVIIDAPLLFESGFNKECDFIICVTAPEELSVKRIMKRDSISKECAEARLKTQISNSELTEKSDFVIENDDSDKVRKDVEECVLILKKLNIKSKKSKVSLENNI